MADRDEPGAEANPYGAAVRKLEAEGFRFDPHTRSFERGDERVTLRWNGRVYARRRGRPGRRADAVAAAACRTAFVRRHTVAGRQIR